MSEELINEINRILELAGIYDNLTQNEIDKINALNLTLEGSLTCQALFIIKEYILPWRNISCSGNIFDFLNDLADENDCDLGGEIEPEPEGINWMLGGSYGRHCCGK